MDKKQFKEQVLQIRRIILAAIPVGVSFAAIIVALVECIKIYQEQELFPDE